MKARFLSLNLLAWMLCLAAAAFAQSPEPLAPLRTIALGDAWGATTVNTVVFRRSGLLTADRYQFAAAYLDPARLLIVRRSLADDSVTSHVIAGAYTLRDAHNTACLGADHAGYLHLAYDMHAQGLNYRRSAKPFDIGEWSDPLPMSGVREDKVTYPQFLLPEKGPLLFLARFGSSGNGDLDLRRYDESSKAWSAPATILKGTEQKPWTSNAYWNQPALGADGSLRLSFTWRTVSLPNDGVNNINIGYCRSDDGGATWRASTGAPFRLPITQANAETILAVPPGSNMMNQCASALDSKGNLHIAYYADDSAGIPQYQHLWFDGKQWRNRVVSARTADFALSGVGTLSIPISRPEIVIDPSDRVYFIARGDRTGDRMAAVRLSPPEYDPAAAQARILFGEPLGHAEPVIDRARWERDHILSMLIQKNAQPAGDNSRALPADPQPLRIVEWDLGKM